MHWTVPVISLVRIKLACECLHKFGLDSHMALAFSRSGRSGTTTVTRAPVTGRRLRLTRVSCHVSSCPLAAVMSCDRGAA